MNDLFARAQSAANYDFTCYINADIVLTQSLIDAIQIVRKRYKRFVMVCAPWRVSMSGRLDFTFSAWESELRNLVKKNSKEPTLLGVDLYLFPRGYYHNIPPFALGRRSWDSWLIYKARLGKIPFIDATQFIFMVHPNHEGSSHNNAYLETEELHINECLAKDLARTFRRSDIPYILGVHGRLQRKQIFGLLRIYLRAIKLFFRKRLQPQSQ